MEETKRARSHPEVRSFGYGIAAIALCAGYAGAPIQGIAWADSPGSVSTSGATVHAGTTGAGSTKPANSHRTTKHHVPPENSATGTKGEAKPDQAETRVADPDPDSGTDDTEADEPSDTAESKADVADGEDRSPASRDTTATDNQAHPEYVGAQPIRVTGGTTSRRIRGPSATDSPPAGPPAGLTARRPRRTSRRWRRSRREPPGS